LIQDMLPSVGGAVVPLSQLQSALYYFLVDIATAAPVSDITALIHDVLTSVAGAVVPLTQLQSDIALFLFNVTVVEPAVDARGRIDAAALSDAERTWVASELPLLRALASSHGVSLAGFTTWFAPVGGLAASILAATTQVNGASSLSGLAPSFFRPASSELLLSGSPSGQAAVPATRGLTILGAAGVLPLSLAALAALALPGAGGLTLLTATGVRIGYRQAKAGMALRTAGIAGFANPGSGPLGVARSGSLVVIRPRTLPIACSSRVRAASLCDKAA
jgi:hypothetical protein